MIKTLECFEMPIICFNQYLSRILILTLWLGILHIKFSDVLRKYFAITGSTGCSKHLYSKCRVRIFWCKVNRRVWHSSYWKWEIIFFISKVNINFVCKKFGSQINKLSIRPVYNLFFIMIKRRRVNLFTTSSKVFPYH